MASGHVNRTNRPNTWLHRPSLRREKSPCQLGAVHTCQLGAVHTCQLGAVHTWHEAAVTGWAEHVRSAQVFQTSTSSAMARASSTSMPRYLTVLSILVWPSKSCTARRLPVRR